MDTHEQERRIQTVCLLVVAAVALGFALYWLSPVLIPFVLSLFFAIAVAPLVDLQVTRLRFPRSVAVATTLLLAVIALAAVGSLASASVRQLSANAAAYQEQVTQLVTQTLDQLPLEEVGLDRESILASLGDIQLGSVGSLLLGATNALVDLLSRSLLVLIFLVYLLVGGSAAAASGMRGEIESRIERYVALKALLSGATGILVGGVLAILGIDLALVFGLFAFMLNFIPSVGSLVATLLPLPVVLMSPDVSLTTAVLAIAIPGAIQFGIGNVLEPKLMGEALDLHPITILMALIVWGMLWGIVGMLLATPMTAIMRMLFERLEMTRPLANLLAGRIGAERAEPEPAEGAET